MSKPIHHSATLQGGAVAVLSGLVYLWAPILGLSGEAVQAACGTLAAVGTLWSLYGLRRAISGGGP